MSHVRRRTTVFLHEYVTGGGFAGLELPTSWAAEGSAMRRALAEDFGRLDDVDLIMTLDARFPDESGPWKITQVSAGEETAIFAKLAASCDFTLCVAPETGGILLERARMIGEVGGVSLGSSPAAIAITSDKLKTAEVLDGNGVRVPMGIRVVPREGLLSDFWYPAVLKPIDGAGSMDTFVIESFDRIPMEALDMTEAMLQPFVDGQPMSASFVVSERTGIAHLVGECEQRIERGGARLVYGGGVANGAVKDFAEVRRAIESVEGLRGWVGVDFVWNSASGQTTILEINPRVTTSYIGLRRLVPEGAIARLMLDRGLEHSWDFEGRAKTVEFDTEGNLFSADGNSL